MKKKLALILAASLIIGAVPGIAIASENAEPVQAVETADDTAAEKTTDILVEEKSTKEDFVKEDSVKEDFVKEDSVKEDSVKEDSIKEDSVKEESAKETAVKEDAAVDNSAQGEASLSESYQENKVPLLASATTGAGQKTAKTIYIDNTVDNSKSYVTGVVHLTGSGGSQAGYNPEKTIYDNSASVLYSNPKTAQVQGMIDGAYTKVYNIANDVKKRGKTGEFHMSTSTSTGKEWDNRDYEILEDKDFVLIGDSDYLQGAYGMDIDYTTTVTASGDYGKETYYRVEANGWVAGWDIVVSDDGNGTGEADMGASLAEETVTLTATPVKGYHFKGWEIVSGDAKLTDETMATTTFEMPYADVAVKATFEPDHIHTLVKTDRVEPTCTKTGTDAYWTCSECEKMFSDEAGKNEISAPVSIPALGHDWSAWEVVTEATETEDGLEKRTCSRCKEEETRVIPHLVVEYRNVEGDGSSWLKDSTDSLEFLFKRSVNDDVTFSHFTGIQVDGKDAADTNYTAKAGSVVVTLKPEYLNTLSVGDHTLTALFDDADDVTVSFKISEKAAAKEDTTVEKKPEKETKTIKTTKTKTVKKPAKSKSSSDVKAPETGDNNPVIPCGVALAAALVVLAAMRRAERSRQSR